MAFWITLIRGMLAITLGVALIFQPDKARPILVNFMGMFWLISGIISLRWGVRGERARGLSLLAGAVGVLAGIGMLSRRFTMGMVGEDVLLSVVGLIILLTGLMHIVGGFRTGPEERGLFGEHRKWSWTSFFLGIFEIVLGFMLVVSPLDRGPVIYFAASIWVLVGGVILIGDALRLRRLRQQERQESAQEVSPVEDRQGDRT
jgi:uncharacterized membrane protein HdeD (DUF308 family)